MWRCRDMVIKPINTLQCVKLDINICTVHSGVTVKLKVWVTPAWTPWCTIKLHHLTVNIWIQWHHLFCYQIHQGSCEGAAVEHTWTRPSLTDSVPNPTRRRWNHCLVRTPAHWKRQIIIEDKYNMRLLKLLSLLIVTVDGNMNKCQAFKKWAVSPWWTNKGCDRKRSRMWERISQHKMLKFTLYAWSGHHFWILKLQLVSIKKKAKTLKTHL